jgi:uncharacterized protein YndB with AHSA1/START domain
MREQESAGRTDAATLDVSADPASVYAAFADADSIVRWLPPGSMTGRVLEYDFREGGRYGIELSYGDDAPGDVGKTTARTDVSRGRFIALEPGKRIVQSVAFDGTKRSRSGEMLITWTFEPTPTGTRIEVVAENVPPDISRADHDAGLRSSLENLASFLAR